MLIFESLVKKFSMPARRTSVRLIFTLAVTSVTLFVTSASGQSTTSRPANSDKQTVTVQGDCLVNPDKALLQKSGTLSESTVGAALSGRPLFKHGCMPETGGHGVPPSQSTSADDLESQLAAMKAENAAVRETLTKMQEQQKALLEMLDRLQRKIDGQPVANSASADQSAISSGTGDNTIPSATATDTSPTETAAVTPAPAPQPTPEEDRYKDGIVIWETKGESSVPFQLRFTNITQFRYLNTQSANDTFTDHLGNVRTVAHRNDVGVNRSMFTFAGYIFDKRLRYNLLT